MNSDQNYEKVTHFWNIFFRALIRQLTFNLHFSWHASSRNSKWKKILNKKSLFFIFVVSTILKDLSFVFSLVWFFHQKIIISCIFLIPLIFWQDFGMRLFKPPFTNKFIKVSCSVSRKKQINFRIKRFSFFFIPLLTLLLLLYYNIII